jgi:SAM-dependent methyltransferase
LTLPQIKRAVGVDESETSLDWAKTRGSLAQDARVNFCKDLSQIESQERFDLVLVFNVLHHVPPEARSEVLKSLIARMNPQGSLVIWEHNRWNPLTRLLVKICPFDEGVVLLSRSALLNVGSKLGLKVVEASYVNVTPPHWHRFFLFFGIEKLLAGIPLGAQWRVVFER